MARHLPRQVLLTYRSRSDDWVLMIEVGDVTHTFNMPFTVGTRVSAAMFDVVITGLVQSGIARQNPPSAGLPRKLLLIEGPKTWHLSLDLGTGRRHEYTLPLHIGRALATAAIEAALAILRQSGFRL